jgi:hypothetical protein
VPIKSSPSSSPTTRPHRNNTSNNNQHSATHAERKESGGKRRRSTAAVTKTIIGVVMGRSPCCEKAHTNKGAWTKEEDDRLVAYIKAHGEGCWRSLPKAAGLLRCGKSCRLRWINYLRPDLKRGNFTEEEDELIIKLHSLLGNKYVSSPFICSNSYIIIKHVFNSGLLLLLCLCSSYIDGP